MWFAKQYVNKVNFWHYGWPIHKRTHSLNFNSIYAPAWHESFPERIRTRAVTQCLVRSSSRMRREPSSMLLLLCQSRRQIWSVYIGVSYVYPTHWIPCRDWEGISTADSVQCACWQILNAGVCAVAARIPMCVCRPMRQGQIMVVGEGGGPGSLWTNGPTSRWNCGGVAEVAKKIRLWWGSWQYIKYICCL